MELPTNPQGGRYGFTVTNDLFSPSPPPVEIKDLLQPTTTPKKQFNIEPNNKPAQGCIETSGSLDGDNQQKLDANDQFTPSAVVIELREVPLLLEIVVSTFFLS